MKSKIKPILHYLIVEERLAIKKVGRIEMPGTVIEDSQNQITEGIIIDMGPTAFSELDTNDRPKIGDVVYFLKYEGIAKVYNKKFYRILSDAAVYGVSKKYLELDEDLLAN